MGSASGTWTSLKDWYLPPPEETPRLDDEDLRKAKKRAMALQAAASGRSSTFTSGVRGDTSTIATTDKLGG